METLKIKGMSCQHCAESVKKALEDISGLSQVSVKLEKGEASYNNSGVSLGDIKTAVSRIGFDPG